MNDKYKRNMTARRNNWKRFPILWLCLLLLNSAGNAVPFSTAQNGCSGAFIAHALPHITTPRSEIIRFYESNGSGVAINDLNNDGLLDIVLGNLKGRNTILWNQGGLQFRKTELRGPAGRTRAVQIVDVDADGLPDIVLTTQTAAPAYWRNHGDETFTLEALPGVDHPAYTLLWADFDRDGDLDLVTASYDAELFQLMRDSFLFNGGAGVYAYENRDGRFIETRLADESQALAIWLSDLDGDGAPDLVIGNDFSFPDQHWTYRMGEWLPVEPFPVTTYSTMSFDIGDINNDGTPEFFAADMLPYQADDAALRVWKPVLDDIYDTPLPADNRQIYQNVLLVRHAEGGFTDRAEAYGVHATGWSWSSKFGDLDHDGYLDLYVVNGMIAQELFPRQPNDELVEPNLVFRNQNGERFIAMSEWGLGSIASGRGMSMGDLDNDGDLDIVVNNLNSTAMLYKNDLCHAGSSLQVELRDPERQNRYGIGAVLTLVTPAGRYTRDLRAASGYLSGDPARVHFGVPVDATDGDTPLRLIVQWADGGVTETDVAADTRFITVTRATQATSGK